MKLDAFLTFLEESSATHELAGGLLGALISHGVVAKVPTPADGTPAPEPVLCGSAA